MTTLVKSIGGRRSWAALCALLLLQLGCGLGKTTVPGLNGPSELGLSFEMKADPDVLVADGVSTSSLQVVVRNQNGQPVSGQAITFFLSDSAGLAANIGTLSSDRASTGNNGIAQVIYRAPVRTDFTANGSVLIQARPISNDFNGQIYREVRIELRSAEPHLFPQGPGAGCSFTTEPASGVVNLGQDFLFQDTSGANVVRFFWDFGDGRQDDKPDVVHRYGLPGTYSVTHITTSNLGVEAVCSRDVTVLP